MWSGCRLQRMFHHSLLSPGGYGDLELIRSTCVLCMGVRVRRRVSRETLECSSAQHVPGKFCHHLGEERRREGRRAARRKGETDGGVSGEWSALKREGKRGNMRDGGGGEFGWNVKSVGEELELSREGCEKALPVGSHPSGRNVGSRPPNMPPLCLLHLSFCRSHSLPHSIASSLIHPSEVLKAEPGPSSDTLIIRPRIASFAKCNKWTRICFSVETAGGACQQIMS